MLTPTTLIEAILTFETRMTQYFDTHPVGKLTAPFQRSAVELSTFPLKLALISLEKKLRQQPAAAE